MTILVVDDDAFNREGVRLFLEGFDFPVIEAGDAESAWEQVQTNQLQAVVLDIVLPQKKEEKVDFQVSVGVTLAGRIKRSYPSLGIVLFSAYEDRGSAVLDMICHGVRGLAYKLKGATPTTVLEAIYAVQTGQVVIDAEVTNLSLLSQRFFDLLSPLERPWVKQTAEHLATLTDREQKIAYFLAASHTPSSIADQLNLSQKTIENHITNIYKKTGLDELDPQLRQIVILAKACMLRDLENL